MSKVAARHAMSPVVRLKKLGSLLPRLEELEKHVHDVQSALSGKGLALGKDTPQLHLLDVLEGVGRKCCATCAVVYQYVHNATGR